MPNPLPSFEIHVHGDIPLRQHVTFATLQETLRPLWTYAGVSSLAHLESHYEEEPGLYFDEQQHLLNICWTLIGDKNFKARIEETCLALNEVAAHGAYLEVSFFEADLDDEIEDASNHDDEDDDTDFDSDFMLMFIGPNVESIIKVQRDLLIQDVLSLMERHFDINECGEVSTAIDALFTQRLNVLNQSMKTDWPQTRNAPSSTNTSSNHNKPKRLH